MATRLYTTGAAAGISPSVASGWEAAGDLIRKAASRATADYAQILATPSGTGVAGEDVVHFQMVYGPLAAGSFNGTTDTVKGQFPAREVSGSTDARAQIVIRAIAPNGSTVRFTALNFDTAAASSEFVISGVNTSLENRKFPRGGAATLAAGSWSDGDYLVIEVGHRNHGTNTGGVRVISGGTSRTGDLAENETTTIDATGSSAVGWIEFSTNIAPITQVAANVATTVAFTANNAKTTIKPTANVATTVAFTANDATVSYVVPPRTVLINSVDYTTKIRWDSFSFIECANRGQVGMSGFDIDDATNTADIPALKLVAADDPRAGQSNKRMFTGFTHDRRTERGPNKVAGQRQWGVELLDLNTLADDYILTDAESADRPAETDYARVVWLLTTRFNTVAGVASGVVPNSNTVNMDATDYRGRRARDVLNECSEMAGKNWFIYLYTTATPLLFYDVTSGSNLTSSARISDVATDVDSSVTWAASSVKVHRSPDDIYSTVHLRWNEGTVTRTNATTASTYRTREISVSDMSIASSAQAIVKADAFLAASASEKIRVENVTVVVPAANVNDIRAGQRIEIKLDRHGISAFTYYRILQRQVEPLNDISYKITLTLADQVLPVLYSGGGRGGDLPYGIWEKKSNATDDGATVIIDRGGITVTDGALTLTDEFGSTVLESTGFAGSWTDYVRLGLYNARFTQALAGTIQSGRTSDLPFWTLTHTGSGTLTGIAGGGVTATFSATSDVVKINSDQVPVQPGGVIETGLAILSNRAAGNLTATVKIRWFQYDGSASATAFTAAAGYFGATSVTSLLWIRDSMVVPTDAVSALFSIEMSESSHNAANSISIYAAKLQDIPVQQPQYLGVASGAAVNLSPGSGTVNDYDPGSDSYALLQLVPSGNLTMTGLVAPVGGGWRLRYLNNYNSSGFSITLKHTNGGSATANQFRTPGTVDYVISSHGSALLIYNATDSRWMVLDKA